VDPGVGEDLVEVEAVVVASEDLAEDRSAVAELAEAGEELWKKTLLSSYRS
jgi:hypothetical protein